jgi:hypothetical protein
LLLNLQVARLHTLLKLLHPQRRFLLLHPQLLAHALKLLKLAELLEHVGLLRIFYI